MKICIIGNGLTALILAKNLLKRKISVYLVEDPKKYNISNVRTIGITEKNLDFLNQLYPKINKEGFPIKKIEIFNYKNSEKILEFDSRKKNEMWMFKYKKIYDFVKKKLYKESRFHTTKKNLDRLILNKNFLNSYDLIIDTQLNNSFSRANFSKRIKKDYFSKAFVTIFKHKKILNNSASQIFTSYGPLAFLPLSSTETSVVFSVKNFKNSIIQQNEVKELIKKYNLKYEITKFDKFEVFDLKLSLFRKYFHKNVLAFGDTLHRIHPLAGQGFNMNLRDTKGLMHLIDYKLKLGYPLDKSILHDFEKNYKHTNTLFASGIDLIHEFFQVEKKIPIKISKKIFKIFNSKKIFNDLSKKFANEGLNF